VLLRLAEGGMADVFVAMTEDRSLVVLKRIPSARQVSPGLIECLREEARLAARLDHPNVCRLLATTEDERGEDTLQMEYLEGVQLRRLASPSSDLALIAGLLVQSADGLDHVHDATEDDGRPAGIVHRDVNPQNLMVTVSGQVKLLDFGIAKARDTELRTGTGSIKGTPAYLSPEQVRGEPVDRRADVFALGSTVVKLLVGEAPFARDNFFATVQAITGGALPDLHAQRPDLPEPLVAVLTRALARERDDRYQTAGEFASAFVTALPAGIHPLAPPAIGARITGQFGLEIADRRRRIEFAIDELDSGTVPTAPDDASPPRLPTATTQLLRDAPTSVTLERPDRARRRGVLVAVLGLAVVTAAVLVGARVMRDPGGAATRTDAAVAEPTTVAVAPPPLVDANVPAAPLPDAAIAPAPPPRDRPPHRPIQRDRTKPPEPQRPAASPEPGYLTIGSTPFATIHVDGVKLGVTPLFRKPLAAGHRRVRAECSCGKSRELWVTIEAGAAAPPIKLTW
jgi:tRNA A-37 threonylcarbamoyl transferase component Bud32